MDDPLKQVAEAMNNHQITDDDGLLTPDDTDVENTTALEENTEDKASTAEKPAETEATAPKAEEDGTEPNFGVDESGKRYVPEKRFKEVYANLKEKERELAEAKSQQQTVTSETAKTPSPIQGDKTQALELDLLKATLPQFNPESAEYDPDLDKLGAQLYNANPGITMVEAGRRALQMAKSLTKKQAQVVAEARAVKSEQSDQGTAGRAKSKGEAEIPNPDKMTLEQMEEFLKSNGQW